jgi:hypothetical protein
MMRAAGLAAMVLSLLSEGAAPANALDISGWRQEATAWVHSLLGERPTDREIIAPPDQIDPKMALAPPQPGGTMRVITPPRRLKQQ